ncbi:MAG: hypothetical protein AAB403_10490 [Planctomycetota bacterium]
MQLTVDDAIGILVEYLTRNYGGTSAGIGNYGYDLSLLQFLAKFAVERMNIPNNGYIADDPAVQAVSPVFLDAVWTLCRRGLMRPSVARRGGQGLPTGEGYSLTAAGRAWLADTDRAMVPSDPSRFGTMIEKYADLLGDAFRRRAHEAIKCHETGTYLAACAMAGAAAEGVLLEVATAKVGNRERVLRMYLAKSGRREVTNLVLAGISEPLASQMKMLLDLLGYWRDNAAHGADHVYTEVEAHDALSRLLRLAMRVGESWSVLTRTPS